MSTEFFSSGAQLKAMLDRAHGALYQYMHEHSHNPGQQSAGIEWIRLGAPFIGTISGILTITTRIALIAEHAFKGLCNISGALLFIRNASFVAGLSQLVLGTLEHTLKLPLSCLQAVRDIGRESLCMVGFDIFHYSNYKWAALDENKRRQDAELLEEIRQRELKEKETATIAEPPKSAQSTSPPINTNQELLDLKNTVDLALQQPPSSDHEKEHLYAQCVQLTLMYYQNANTTGCLEAHACADYARAAAGLYEDKPWHPKALWGLGVADIVSGQEWVPQLRAAEKALTAIQNKMNPEAFPHYLTLAKYGNYGAEWMVGAMLWTGYYGGPPNLELALAWFEQLRSRESPSPNEFQPEITRELFKMGDGAHYHVAQKLNPREDAPQDRRGSRRIPAAMPQVVPVCRLATYEMATPRQRTNILDPRKMDYPAAMQSGFDYVRTFFRPGDYDFTYYPISPVQNILM